jgi:hypothetical protein
VDITCSTLQNVVMAKPNLTIQLDEATIRHGKIVAAHRGLSLSSLVARELWDGRCGSLSSQVLQEFYAVVTRKFKPAMPQAKARAILAAYWEWRAVATEPQL